MDGRPIAIYDSGMGGLTVLHECLVTMPNEDFVYLGDTGRFPYGPRPLDEIRGFALEIGRFLERQGVKMVVVACNSATSAALADLQAKLETNHRMLHTQLQAAQAVSEIIAKAIRESQSDGTYSDRYWMDE